MSSQQRARWVVWDLKPNNVPANALCTIVIENISLDIAFEVGVRKKGASSDHKFKLSPKNAVSITVQADRDSKIELYAEDYAKINFTLFGFLHD